jgi:putative membrane protein
MGAYLWVKAFHIVFVSSWFAGLFYLPRIFVNLAMVPPTATPSASGCC